MEYGLIGYPLKHSFSKEVHSFLSDYNYELHSLDESLFDEFMIDRKFKAINVTIPYKQKVIPYISNMHKDALNIKAVNTIINKNNVLYGFNTDVLGVIATFRYCNIDINEKNVLILGTGATSNTVAFACKKCKANNVYKAYRKNSKVIGDVLYEEVNKLASEIDIIINTTPAGMYPHMWDDDLINFDDFKNIKFAMDVVYNPLRTKFILNAEKKGINNISGLYMLIAQAVYANKIFLMADIDEIYNREKLFDENDEKNIKSTVDNMYFNYYKNKQNIVLTGMPTCGKSTIANEIATKYNYELIDTDLLINDKVGMKTGDYITKYGEDKFREVESEIVKEISSKTHCVIATGGGIVLKNENIENLKLNGKIFFINRPFEKLFVSSDRPLTSTQSQLREKYDVRLPIYREKCDVEIDAQSDVEGDTDNIMKRLVEKQ